MAKKARAKVAARRASQRKGNSATGNTAVTNSSRRYKKNFLKQVVVRMDFGEPLAISKTGLPKHVVSDIRKSFPAVEQQKQTMKQVRLSGIGLQEKLIDVFEWFYHSKDKTKRLHAADDHVVIIYDKYDSFDCLYRDFELVVTSVYGAFPSLSCSRLGLRYIDHIDIKESRPTDWSDYINPQLLGSFALADDLSTVSRMFNVLEFNYGDMKMRFQYGMPNADYPAPIKKKLFVLDYDAFCESEIGRDDILRLLVKFHDKIKTSFEEVITDGLRRKMGQRNA